MSMSFFYILLIFSCALDIDTSTLVHHCACTLPIRVKQCICNVHIIANNFESWHWISNNVVCATSKALDQPAHVRSLIRAFAGRLNIL